jgi:phage terminase small subunit
MDPLRNRKHEIFAREIASGAPLRAAYISAGYRDSAAARFNASRLRNTSTVKGRIDALNAQFAEASGIKTAWLMEQYVKVVLADPKRDANRLHEVATRISIDGNGEQHIEVDRIGALNSLARMLGAFVNKMELSGANGGPVEIEAVSDQEAFRKLLTDSVALFGSIGMPQRLLGDLSVAIDELYPEFEQEDAAASVQPEPPGRRATGSARTR